MKIIKKQLTDKISDFSASSTNKNIRRQHTDIEGFDLGCPSRSKFVKNGNGDVVQNFHVILKRLKNHFSLLLKLLHWATSARSQFLKEVFLKVQIFWDIAPF